MMKVGTATLLSPSRVFELALERAALTAAAMLAAQSSDILARSAAGGDR
jgi:hypothetical protein